MIQGRSHIPLVPRVKFEHCKEGCKCTLTDDANDFICIDTRERKCACTVSKSSGDRQIIGFDESMKRKGWEPFDDELAEAVDQQDMTVHDVIGNCPVCGSSVCVYSDRFACVKTGIGKCNLSISYDRLDSRGVPCDFSNIEKLLNGGLTIRKDRLRSSKLAVSHMQLIYSEEHGWDIQTRKRPLPIKAD